MVHSRVQYEIILWGSTFHSTLRELEVRLNDIVRTMTGRRKFDHVSPLYKNLSLLKLQIIYKLELAKFMYQFSFNKLPKIIESAFPKIENIHNHNTTHTQNTKFFHLLKMLQKINCRLKESNFGNQYQMGSKPYHGFRLKRPINKVYYRNT